MTILVSGCGVTESNGSLSGQTVKAGEASEENRIELRRRAWRGWLNRRGGVVILARSHRLNRAKRVGV